MATERGLAALAGALLIGSGLLGAQGAAAGESFHVSNDSFCVAAATGADCDGFEQWKTYRGANDSANQMRLEGWAFTEPSSTNNQFGEADLIDYGGGTGLRNRDADTNNNCGWDEDCNEGNAPEHAMDNNERDEFMLVQFDSTDWALTDVGTGWAQEDGGSSIDFQVYYWNGGGSGPGSADGGAGDGSLTADNGGRDLSGTDLNGWSLLGDYTFAEGTFNQSTNVQGGGQGAITSQYWLVSAKVCNVSSTCGYDDHFKLNLIGAEEVAGNDPPTPGVPEPATLLLLAAAAPFMRKRLQGRAQG